MADKYNFPFYKYPFPPHHRISFEKLQKVYTPKFALWYCGQFNLEDKLENFPILIERIEDDYGIFYNNPYSIHHLEKIQYIDCEEYVQISEETRNLIAENIKKQIKQMEMST